LLIYLEIEVLVLKRFLIKSLLAFSPNADHMTMGVEDVAASVQKAVNAGAVEEQVDETTGQLIVKLRDPFGYVWYICERKSLALFKGSSK